MAANESYHKQQAIANELKLRELRKFLPGFCDRFFRGIEPTTASRTRIAYATDLKVFFSFVQNHLDRFRNTNVYVADITLLNEITCYDIENYLDYLKVYTNDEGVTLTNDENGLKRKLSAVRAMYRYFYFRHEVTGNPAAQVAVPKIHEKAIIRLDENETAELLDTVEYGAGGSDQQQRFHEKNKTRDLAMVTLLLGTGIRISECIGLNIEDLDFDNDRIKVTRKGGNEAYVYFGGEVREALLGYLDERRSLTAIAGHEDALFLSNRLRRMTVRTAEVLVKKYAKSAVSLKKITPHKLRSTYGTQLYKETGDIYLVADVLGHKDVNTTRRHYAAIEEERRRQAKDKVHLRKDD
ncbi:MAG: tyrosine-type recombinase/integrase [Lachnospiraceae bacterium]|nr:tyrosine-type recombinase/integrase [Lachnospiraceae bacterium]